MKCPWSVQVSLVEGCNRRCEFCGIRSIRDQPMQDVKPMPIPVVEALATQLSNLPGRPRVELAMHGEPTLHPMFLDYVRMIRRKNRYLQISLTTNGFGIFSGRFGSPAAALAGFFMAGIDFVVLDSYGPEGPAQEGLARVAAMAIGAQVIDFNHAEGPSPWHNHRRALRRALFLMGDLGKVSGQKRSRVIFNHAGNSKAIPPAAAPRRAGCTIPFREMSVCWNGDVCGCCMDWKHELVAGNILRSGLAEIWDGAVFGALRRSLAAKNRSFAPCTFCDCGAGTRPGLLPKQAQATDEDMLLLRKGGYR